MPRLQTRPISEVGEYQPILKNLEEFFGFLPNDYLTMGHKPAVMKAVADLTATVMFAEGKTPIRLRLLAAYITSRAAQCMYCFAHCGSLAVQQGISLEVLQNISEYETHPAFTSEERAVLRVAEKAGATPNQVSDEDFANLREHFDEEGCAEIVSTIALMGFYNRWNDTIATTLEKPPLKSASEHLTATGWEVGKHAAAV